MGEGRFPKLIITRPETQGHRFAEMLYEKISTGVVDKVTKEKFFDRHLLFAPVMTIQLCDFIIPSLEDFDLVVVSSANAVDRIRDQKMLYDKPLFVVGSMNAQELAQAGYSRIIHVAPTMGELVQAISPLILSEGKRVLYLRGRDASFEGVSIFGSKWMDIVTYIAARESVLPSSVIEAMRANEVNGVTFFSRRSAEIFIDLAKAYGLIPAIKSIKALCISQPVLECVQPVFGREVYVAETPNGVSMLNLVQETIFAGYSKS